MSDVYEAVYNPDVLECIANLSNDEVFTPPEVANAILDLLPQELFSDPNTKFLDPACKSGVFLREIAKRLLTGLEDKIPDLQERVDHIFKNQIYGIAITELTSLLSRRSVYCCKYADNKYSVTKFNDLQGNIFFSEAKHLWVGGKCLHCGIGQQSFEEQFADKEEKHAYQFIHNAIPGDLENMKFDVIIGNPPYQMSDGGNAASASPIYHYFVEQAQKLNPKYMSFIIPARWYAGGKGLDQFREKMLNDKRIRVLHDYMNSSECFNGVEIKGGICYFLWERDNPGKCKVYNHSFEKNTSLSERNLIEGNENIFIRFNNAISIVNKIKRYDEKSFSSLVSARKPFGLPTNFRGHKDKKDNSVILYENNGISYIDEEEVLRGKEYINECKVFISRAYGAGEDFPHQILNKPIAVVNNTACTETYLMIGPFKNQNESENVVSYIKTKLFRFLVLLIKNTQDATSKVYQFVPLQDFSKPWTDAELYQKYELTQEEIEFIESMIRPME